MAIGKDIWIRLEKAGILSKGMNESQRKYAIRKTGPYKLMKIKGIGEDKAYILLHYAGWKISREELKKTYDKLKIHTELGDVKAARKKQKQSKKIDLSKIIKHRKSREGRKQIIKKGKSYEQKLYNIYQGKITCAYAYNVKQKDGRYFISAKRTQRREKYLFPGFKDVDTDLIVVIECPSDVLAIEFEEHSTEKDSGMESFKQERDKWIRQTYENAKKLKIDGCAVDHGGTSQYFYAFNLKGLPEGNEKEAKKVLVKIIVPKQAQHFVDWSNLGRTLVPIIGRPHWKPKYKGAIHKVIYGKDPLNHESHIEKLIVNKVREKKIMKYDEITEDLRRKAPLRSLLIKYGYDISKNPTMCRLGHKSKGEACFSYDEDKGLFYCFHRNSGGTIFNLVMEHEKVSFEEAKKIVAKEFGIEIKEKKVGKTKIIDKSPIERMKKAISRIKK